MRYLAVGVWDISYQVLDRIGRGAAWLLKGNKSLRKDSGYAIAGGALLFGLFGVVIGYALSRSPGGISGIDGAVLGGLLGTCMGILFGSSVEVIDRSINNLLKSLNSK